VLFQPEKSERKKKTISLLRISMPQVSMANEVWSMDFVHASCVGGMKLNVLVIVDD
jgi:hypothetical protein